MPFIQRINVLRAGIKQFAFHEQFEELLKMEMADQTNWRETFFGS